MNASEAKELARNAINRIEVPQFIFDKIEEAASGGNFFVDVGVITDQENVMTKLTVLGYTVRYQYGSLFVRWDD